MTKYHGYILQHQQLKTQRQELVCVFTFHNEKLVCNLTSALQDVLTWFTKGQK